MTCPFHDSDSSDSGGYSESTEKQATDGPGGGRGGGPRDRGIDRRSFLKSALAIGGAAALNTALGLAGMPDGAAAEGGSIGVAERLNRQHAWDDYEYEDPEKGTLPPARHVLLLLDYRGDGEPADAHRRQVQRAFRELESTVEWDHEGVLFTIGYSPAYFDRFRDDGEVVLPPGLSWKDPENLAGPQGLIPAGALIETPGVTLDHEDPIPETDGEAGPTYDACLHLASEHEQNVLAAEELLWGGTVDIDGDGEAESLDHTLEGVFDRPTEYPGRRVGFAGTKNLRGEGNAGEEGGIYPEEVPVDDGAKLSMGFNDLFKNSIPREDLVTILEDQQLVDPKPPGVFAQGTIKHVSKLDLNLDPEGNDPGFEDTSAETVADDGWYQYDDQERVERMFSSDHDIGEMGVVGDELGSSNAPYRSEDGSNAVRDLSADEPDVAERTESDANHEDGPGVAGHVQKCARARFDMETRVTDDVPGDYPYVTERDDDFLRGHDGDQEAEQVMLRRDFNTIDNERPGLHFVSLMRFNPYMAYMRQAMNGVPFDSAAFGLVGDAQIDHAELDVDPSDNGIAGFCKTRRRGNYLVPPLTQRALPHPQGEDVDISVERAGGNFRVAVEGIDAGELADGTIRFGRYLEVNAGGGVEPRQEQQRGNRTTFVFPVEGTNLDDGGKARLFAQREGSLKPVRGTATIEEDSENSENGTEKQDEGGNNGKGNGRNAKAARADD